MEVVLEAVAQIHQRAPHEELHARHGQRREARQHHRGDDEASSHGFLKRWQLTHCFGSVGWFSFGNVL